jgi:F-type H+-transporting ATPase subunit a
MLNIFAATEVAEKAGPVIHIAPAEVFSIGGYSITNSILYGWIASSVIILLMVWAARKIKLMPARGPLQIVEIGVDFIINLVSSSLGSREKGLKYGPYFVAIFFFVILNNWLGLVPGVGEAFTVNDGPLFRPFTADLNGTLAAAVVTMTLVQYIAIKESGWVKHIGHYFNGSLKNPATYLFGVFEIFTEFTRIISLALRLFLNVVIGEIVIAVFAYLGSAAAPLTALPFTLLELAVAGLQAYIFVMLSVTYLAVAMHHSHDEEHELVSAESH